MKTSRKKLSPPLRAEVISFYGNRCILDPGPSGAIDLHHINEHHADDRFENFVPLCPTCNRAIRDSNYPRKETLKNEQNPERIAVRAKECFADGDFPCSYGCNRVAAHLFAARHGDISRQLQCLNAAIGSLRPIFQPRLLRDTVSYISTLLDSLPKQSQIVARAEFMSQMGLVLYDFGYFRKASEWQLAAFKTRKSVQRELLMANREIEEQNLANYARRLAQMVQYNPAVENAIRREVLGSLSESLSLYRKYNNFRGVGTNLDVLALLEIREFGQATGKVCEFAIEALEVENKINNEWVRASHYINKGLHFAEQFEKTKSVRDRNRGISELEKGCDILSRLNIRLEPNPANGSTVRPDLVLQKLGGNPVKLAPQRGVLPFSSADLNVLAKRARNH